MNLEIAYEPIQHNAYPFGYINPIFIYFHIKNDFSKFLFFLLEFIQNKKQGYWLSVP